MQYKPGTFILVPSKYLLKQVDAISQSIFLWLCDHIDRETNTCYPSIRRLAELSNVSKNTVKDRIKKLENIGLIEKTIRKKKDGTNRSNLYMILIDEKIPIKKDDGSVSASYRSRNYNSTGQEMATNQNQLKQKPRKEKVGSAHTFAIEFFNQDDDAIDLIFQEIYQETNYEKDYIKIEIDKFISYWTETSYKNKQRWELENTFEIKRRFLRWLDMDKTNNLKRKTIREV